VAAVAISVVTCIGPSRATVTRLRLREAIDGGAGLEETKTKRPLQRGVVSNKRMNLTKPRAPFTLAGRFRNAALQVMRGR
jgi:hypothetical protein